MRTLILILFFGLTFVRAQENKKPDSLAIEQDTMYFKEIVIDEVLVTDLHIERLTKEEKEQLKLLQKRVRVVYPYAKLTAEKLISINETMAKLKTQKEKKKYFKLVEKYLNNEFEPKLKKLSQKQGQILVKLIFRQTGLSTFDLIKNYKSGWKAFWSNNTAKVFNIDLKKKYDPMEVPEDYCIESYLIKCFEEGKLVKQEAKNPVTEKELIENWLKKNNAEKKE